VVLIVALVVALGLALAQDQETLKVRSAVAAEDERAPYYVAALVGAVAASGNSYDVLTNGDEIFPAMLQAIDGSRRRISFETYIYEDGAVAERFTSAFEQAARRGVEVSMVLDLFGSSGMKGEHLDRLKAAGCKVVTLNTPRWYELEEVNYRTHRKILVVDGEVGFTGGAGIADHWLGNAQDKTHWRDTQVRMRGPIVRLLEGAFYENFIEAGGIVTPILGDPTVEIEELGADETSLLLRGSPTGGGGDLKRLYLLAIAMARRSLDIVSPYFITDESSMWSLADAAGRGVRIRILVEGDTTDAKPVKYSSRAAYDRLMSLGIELYEYQPTMLHAKVLIADGAWSMFGSANFDNRSLELNDELNVAVTNRNLAGRFKQDFERDLRAARRLELGSWRNRPRIDKIREQFWSLFGEVF
jgi:cardiolipin synthase